MAVETAMKKSYNVKLNFRLGWLKFNDNCFYFDNLAQKSDLDNVTMTSSNTEFRNNKWLMTNFKLPKTGGLNEAGDAISYRSSVRDTIASVISAQTPKTYS
jgi:hypothetical protein